MKVTRTMNANRTSYVLTALIILLGMIALGRDARGETSTELERSKVCMLEDTVQTHDGLPQVYKGKTYYLCCHGCVSAFQGDPEKYSHATDPVDGSRVDKADAPVYAYAGRAYFFHSWRNLQEFAKRPEKYLKENRRISLKRN